MHNLLGKIKTLRLEIYRSGIDDEYELRLQHSDDDFFDVQEEKFDINGNLIEIKKYYKKKLLYSLSKVYDASGNIIQLIEINKNSRKHIKQNIYNINNQLVSTNNYNEDGELNGSTNFFYNAINQLVTTKQYNKIGTIVYSRDYFYNSENLLEKSSNDEEEYLYYETYKYNEDKLISEYIEFELVKEYDLTKILQKLIYSYEKDGLVKTNISDIYGSEDLKEYGSKEILKFDINNNLVQIQNIKDYTLEKHYYDCKNRKIWEVGYYCSEKQNEFENETIFKDGSESISWLTSNFHECSIYDYHNNLIEVRTFNAHNYFSREMYVYKYDNIGNWIEKQSFIGALTDNVEKRIIEYY